ncbi:hypothetical protein CBR_g28626 [Chara braunii]|uniref:Integrase catalytic domain-containing protein n=1 Tax=Chara braunii TaxID=69332 RepID=A0A388L9K1_CHABU|nr:hypothetical protein CBR_g28626 [Chara braunii]|eukprot:GBG78912.1 hypothetical protein CBR_g28626 [Chara braunii]
MGVCFVHALPPHDASSTDSSSDPRITELLDAYGDVFEGPHGVVLDRPIRHEIILEDEAVPPRGCIYRMSEEELSVLRAQLDDLLEKGWIRPSSSPYSAPVLFVRKKNKDLRLCIDYRKLNALTIRNDGPLPRIDNRLKRLGGAKFFSKLDLKSGYHQLEIQQEDRYKTAFKTRYGHFEWLPEFGGACGTPVHLLERLRQTKYKANRDKCKFARPELEYLGHYVTLQGIRPLANKIEALRVWPEPTNTTDVRSFMGLARYYQRFITRYSRIAAPMTRLQSPKVPFIFDDDARRTFQALKTAMLMATVLSIYDPTLPTRVTTDASGYGIGAVLEQHDGDDWHRVEYFNHKVPPINSLDDARKKELLAFVMALKRLRHFLLARRRFTWVTDNNPLTYYKTQDTFADIFASPTGVVPDRPISHEIILEAGVVPPKGCIYRMSEEELEVIRAQLDDLLAKGWIRPSSSPYGAPVLFVRKKNKNLRLCIDYRKLNGQTVKNAGPLPRIDDLLERLGGAKYFSKLDLKLGYHQISIRPNDRYKSVFKTRYGHFEWVVMPFGLANAPTTFQAAMTNEFRAMLDRFVLVYLDDILVYSWSLEDNLGHLRRVLKTHSAGISPLSDKIQAIQEWPEPQNVTDVRSFLGLAGYYQRFIKGYSKIAAHLTKLQCKDRPFDFGEDARELFLVLKATLLSAEVLCIYDPLLPTRVTTDASDYGIGVILEQHDGVDWHPVKYFSKKVPVVHSIDNARKKELLTFVHVLKQWRDFLLGRSHFRWVTGNHLLVFYKTKDTVNSTIARWMAFIDQFDFFPDHIPGKSNRFADALSRRPDHCTAVYSTFEIDDDLRNNFIRAYQADPKFRDKYANCSSPNPAPSHYWIQEGYLLVHTRGKDLLCVPSDPHLRTPLLGEFHDAPATRNFGVNRMIDRLRERFWWPGLLGDVTRYCESCEVCRHCKSRNHRPYGELRPLPVPLRRREVIAMDITGPFPKHKTRVDGILTVVDRLTKFAMLLPCRYHAKAPELVEVLYAGWIRTKGYPKEIVCDSDTRFMSTFWLALIKRWGSSLKPSSARHPQTDGQTERAHQTAQVLLRTVIRSDQKDWVERLPDVELAYNSSIHPAIGISPFEFEHGSLVTSPLDSITPRTA